MSRHIKWHINPTRNFSAIGAILKLFRTFIWNYRVKSILMHCAPPFLTFGQNFPISLWFLPCEVLRDLYNQLCCYLKPLPPSYPYPQPPTHPTLFNPLPYIWSKIFFGTSLQSILSFFQAPYHFHIPTLYPLPFYPPSCHLISVKFLKFSLIFDTWSSTIVLNFLYPCPLPPFG